MLAWTFHHREIFECAHLKFTVSGRSKQTSVDTHMRVQWSHASVGLTQAHSGSPQLLYYKVIKAEWRASVLGSKLFSLLVAGTEVPS